MIVKNDLTLVIANKCLSVRAGAIIMKDDKVLMVGDNRLEYLYSVGGRVKMGEDTLDAVRRETYEETGYHLEVDRLGFIAETFFHADDIKAKGTDIYEIGFYYYMRVPDDFEVDCVTFRDGDATHYLKWVDLDGDELLHPAFFKTELKHIEPYTKHIIVDEVTGRVIK